MNKLTCPWCGNITSFVEYLDANTTYRIVCPFCGACSPEKPTAKEAIEKWDSFSRLIETAKEVADFASLEDGTRGYGVHREPMEALMDALEPWEDEE